MQIVQKIANANGWGINPDTAVTQVVSEGLHHNKKVFGARYCPCMLAKVPETICPCKDFKEDVAKGQLCHCQLYIK